MPVLYDNRTPLTNEVADGAAPDSFDVLFDSADDTLHARNPGTLHAGRVGTWTIELSPASPITRGGGYLLERWGFLLGHLTQDRNPAGRDYVTLEADTDARLSFVVNTSNPSHRPPVAKVTVTDGALEPGDRVTIRIGDRSHGGPGSEVYDATTDARLVVGVDRNGSSGPPSPRPTSHSTSTSRSSTHTETCASSSRARSTFLHLTPSWVFPMRFPSPPKTPGSASSKTYRSGPPAFTASKERTCPPRATQSRSFRIPTGGCSGVSFIATPRGTPRLD